MGMARGRLGVTAVPCPGQCRGTEAARGAEREGSSGTEDHRVHPSGLKSCCWPSDSSITAGGVGGGGGGNTQKTKYMRKIRRSLTTRKGQLYKKGNKITCIFYQ